MRVRWTDGLHEGEEAEIDDYVGSAHLASGKAVLVEPEVEKAEVKETPERPKHRRKAASPETR